MTEQISMEIGHLRTLAAQAELRPMPPPQQLNQTYLRSEGLALAHPFEDGLLVVRRAGGKAFDALCERLAESSPAMARGAVFADVRTELFSVLRELQGREPASVNADDAKALHARFEAWFAERAAARRVLVPCVISPWAAQRFVVGPVTFVFADEAAQSDIYPQPDDVIGRMEFDKLLGLMKTNKADWLARVSVDGCDRKRSEEIGDLAVDLALTALQLVIPLAFGSRTMGRLDARRGAIERRTLSEAHGYYNADWSRMDAGTSIGTGTLAEFLRQSASVIVAVGRLVSAFASGQYRLPILERAWCDAAYWLHEALAEPIDAIAIAKLETALEVLLRSENSAGSLRRVKSLLAAFYGLGPDDPIVPEAETTAKQFAKRFVGERSQVLHGTWSTLNSRLAMSRSGLEEFVMAVIRRAAVELEAYSAEVLPDSVDSFLDWVRLKPPANAE